MRAYPQEPSVSRISHIYRANTELGSNLTSRYRLTYPALISKRITNRAAIGGGDSNADVRDTSSPKDFR